MNRSDYRGHETDPTHARTGRSSSDRESTDTSGTVVRKRDCAGQAPAERIVLGQGQKTARIAPDARVVCSTLREPATIHLFGDDETHVVRSAPWWCSCPDHHHRSPEGGCRHIRRVRLATGVDPVPGDLRGRQDPNLGALCLDGPRWDDTADNGEVTVA